MKKYINTVNYNKYYIFWFEFVFKLITILVCLPLGKWFVSFVKNTYDLKFLSVYSFKLLYSHASFYFITLLILFIVSIYFIFDYTVVLLLIHDGLDKNRVNYKETLKKALKKVLCVFKPCNILYLVTPFLFLLFFYIGLLLIIYNYTDYIRLFIGLITSTILYKIGIVALLVILLYIFIRSLFIYNKYILNDISFIKAFKEFSYKESFKTFIVLVLKKIAPIILLFIIVNALSYLFFYFRSEITSVLLSSIVSGIIITILLFILFYYAITAQINDILYISCRYYYMNNEQVSIVNDINKISKIYKYIRLGIFIIICIVFTIIMNKVNNKTIAYDFIFDYHIDITAHRGAYDYAPENTMAAFTKAYDMNVDYIELDVHESKDGYIYVMHDGSLARTLGVNKLDYQVTWDEIKDLNIVSKFDEYRNEKVPLLEDVIKWAKDKDFTLNIELKPTSKSINLENYVVDILHRYNYQNKCVVASFDLNAILKVRSLDSSIKIVYLGNDLKYRDDIDIYSINYTSVTRDMVKFLHKNNKILYVWTVNDDDIVKSLINMGVDNIITNDPPMVQNVVKNYKNRNKTNALLNFLIYLYK